MRQPNSLRVRSWHRTTRKPRHGHPNGRKRRLPVRKDPLPCSVATHCPVYLSLHGVPEAVFVGIRNLIHCPSKFVPTDFRRTVVLVARNADRKYPRVCLLRKLRFTHLASKLRLTRHPQCQSRDTRCARGPEPCRAHLDFQQIARNPDSTGRNLLRAAAALMATD